MNDTTSQVDPLRKAVYISTGVLYLIASLLTTVVNGLLLFAIYKDPYKCFRKPFTVLLAGLAVTDFLVGCLTDCMWAIDEFYCAQDKCKESDFQGFESYYAFENFMDSFIDGSSKILILALAADRFIAVAFPLYYRSSVRLTRALAGVLCIWTFSAIFASLQFTGIPRILYKTISVHIYITSVLIISGILYGAIYWKIRRQRNLVLRADESPASKQTVTPTQVKRFEREKTFMTTAFLIVVCLFFSLIPYGILTMIESKCESCVETTWYFICLRGSWVLICTTSLVNPYLYGWRVRQSRQSLKAVLCCRSNISRPR